MMIMLLMMVKMVMIYGGDADEIDDSEGGEAYANKDNDEASDGDDLSIILFFSTVDSARTSEVCDAKIITWNTQPRTNSKL